MDYDPSPLLGQVSEQIQASLKGAKKNAVFQFLLFHIKYHRDNEPTIKHTPGGNVVVTYRFRRMWLSLEFNGTSCVKFLRQKGKIRRKGFVSPENIQGVLK